MSSAPINPPPVNGAGSRELPAYLANGLIGFRPLDEGYARFATSRFAQALEYRPDVFPEQPRASPFLADTGGFLMSLMLGFPGHSSPLPTNPRAGPCGRSCCRKGGMP
jgi:hypothetical protein